ncbi:MAG: dipeptidase [Clostridia bacterium]|nr:dipeptidase [Clostridia bacterium]
MRSNFDIFDCHADTVTIKNLFHTKSHLNVRDMKKYHRYIQVFALCSENGYAYSHAVHHIKRFERMIKLWRLEKITDKDSLLNAQFGAILALEGSDALAGRISALRRFYDKGVRIITLTWNNNNAAASSCGDSENGGLTSFGKRLIKECEKLGVVVDLSHSGDKTFFDAAEIATKPFICSHSNSRSITNVKRNITDEQFREITRLDGCVGVNFYHEFLENGNLSSIVHNIEHFCALGGENNIGLGSDFDGIDYMPEDCRGATYMEDIASELLRLNYSEETVRKILFGNFMRVFSAVL